jgi:hypothetical protein
MHPPQPMHILHNILQRNKQNIYLVHGQMPSKPALINHMPALTQFRDEVYGVLSFVDLIKFQYVWVVQGLQYSDFRGQLLEEGLGVGEVGFGDPLCGVSFFCGG